MRSEVEQSALPFDVPPRRPRDVVPAAPRAEATRRLRLVDDALASEGLPAGTELLLEPCRTPRRGQVVLAREGTTDRVGVFDVQLGRAALRTDHGSVWLGRGAHFLGAVTLACAPLAGMPDR